MNEITSQNRYLLIKLAIIFRIDYKYILIYLGTFSKGLVCQGKVFRKDIKISTTDFCLQRAPSLGRQLKGKPVISV